jgi:hypothetical protein
VKQAIKVIATIGISNLANFIIEKLLICEMNFKKPRDSGNDEPAYCAPPNLDLSLLVSLRSCISAGFRLFNVCCCKSF